MLQRGVGDGSRSRAVEVRIHFWQGQRRFHLSLILPPVIDFDLLVLPTLLWASQRLVAKCSGLSSGVRVVLKCSQMCPRV